MGVAAKDCLSVVNISTYETDLLEECGENTRNNLFIIEAILKILTYNKRITPMQISITI